MIHGHFDPAEPYRLAPRLQVLIWLPDISRQLVAVDFLIDTGAARTSLHAVDTLGRLGISLRRLRDTAVWPGRSSVRGIGGHVDYVQTTAHYGFLHHDGRQQTIVAPIQIAASDHADTLPSLLGLDILQRFDLSLSWRDGRVTLTERD
ncbi:MAG: hypothetical protein U0531_13690 [Dehalococcoidia bacterium]